MPSNKVSKNIGAEAPAPAGDDTSEPLPVVSQCRQSKTSIAELVYGETLRLPGDFFEPMVEESVWSDDQAQHLVTTLRQRMNALIPAETKVKRSQSQIDKNLGKSGFVYFRRETILNKMAPLYNGPFQVLSMEEKSATLLIKGKPTKVTKERLKTAYVWEDAEIVVADSEGEVELETPYHGTPANEEGLAPTGTNQPVHEAATRSGRTVKPVRRYGLDDEN